MINITKNRQSQKKNLINIQNPSHTRLLTHLGDLLTSSVISQEIPVLGASKSNKTRAWLQKGNKLSFEAHSC